MAALNVADVLAREHELFGAMLDRMEYALRQTEAQARSSIDLALKALLPALDRHEQIEDQVFLHPPDGVGDPTQAMTEVAAQHGKLGALRAEILQALEESLDEYPFAEIEALTTLLISHLRTHLLTEEAHLWPLYRVALARSLDAVVPVHFERRTLALEEGLITALAALPHEGLREPQGSG